MKFTSLQFHQFGPPANVLRVVERETPRVALGDVLVRMNCMPMNPSDLIPIYGAYAHRIALPAIAGYEGVGVVVDVGQGVSKSGGMVLNIGLLSGRPVNWALLSSATRVNARPFWLKHWVRQVSSEAWQSTFELIFGLMKQRQLNLMPIAQRFHIRNIREAIDAAEHPNRFGKVLLTT